MNSASIVTAATAKRDRTSVFALAALAAATIGLAVLFIGEGAAAVRVWNASTAYSHCYFVLPIAVFLAWERRSIISTTDIRPFPAALVLVVPLVVAWLAAERLGIMEGRQLVVIGLLQVLVMALLGLRMWRAAAAPLLYLVFLVPFGAFVTPALQSFTAHFVVDGLDLLGISNYSDAFEIQIPEGNFYVAEACAGLRFLIAAVAFGVLYALLMYRGTKRRLAFIAISIVVPIIANGFRALGIVVLGHIIGSAEAAATDHVLYGWIFFSLVILALIFAGLPFREDLTALPQREQPSPGDFRPVSVRLVVGIAVVFLLAIAAGPSTASYLDHIGRQPVATPNLDFTLPPECRWSGSPSSTEMPGRAMLVRQAECGPFHMTLSIVALSPRSNSAWLALAQRDLTGEDTSEDAQSMSVSIPGLTPPVWRDTETSEPTRMTISSFWIDGVPSQGGLRARIAQARNSVFGSADKPVLVGLGIDRPEARIDEQDRAKLRALLVGVLAQQSTLDAQVRVLSRTKPD